MALTLTSRLQVLASRFWNRRTEAALSHHGVRLDYDPEVRRSNALITGFSVTVVVCALMLVWSLLKPAGQAGDSKIMADRDTGALYVLVDGRLYPALNLVSAQLISGSAEKPKFIKADAIGRYPSGPTVGIPGAPSSLNVRTPDRSRWALCDGWQSPTLMTSKPTTPTVTAIAGSLTLGQRSAELTPQDAILASYGPKTYLVWNGHRAEVDRSAKNVVLALGIGGQSVDPVPLSRPLFDAIPAGPPLESPAIAGAGSPSPWPVGPTAVIGSVLSVASVSGDKAPDLYVILREGLQRISPFVAAVIRGSSSFGDAAPISVTPDELTRAPMVSVLPVDSYPVDRPHLVDTTVNGTTCLSWSKAPTDNAAQIAVLSGQGLPIPASDDARIVRQVRTAGAPSPGPADQVFIGADSANLVMVSGADATSQTKESLWWISDQGVRFGISLDEATVNALGVSPGNALAAPWPLISVYARGPALTRADALTKHDLLTPAPAEALVIGSHS